MVDYHLEDYTVLLRDGDEEDHVVMAFDDEDDICNGLNCSLVNNFGRRGEHVNEKHQGVLQRLLPNKMMNESDRPCFHEAYEINLQQLTVGTAEVDKLEFFELNHAAGGTLLKDRLIMFRKLLEVGLFLIKKGVDIGTLTPDLVVFQKGDRFYRNPKIKECELKPITSDMEHLPPLQGLVNILEDLMQNQPAIIQGSPMLISFVNYLKEWRSGRGERNVLYHPIFLNIQQRNEFLVRVHLEMITVKEQKNLDISKVLDVDASGRNRVANWIDNVKGSRSTSQMKEILEPTDRSKQNHTYIYDKVEDMTRFWRNCIFHGPELKQPLTISATSIGMQLGRLWPKLLPYLFEKYGSCIDGLSNSII